MNPEARASGEWSRVKRVNSAGLCQASSVFEFIELK